MFDTVLIANRGEIAVRAIRTLKRLGIRSVAVYSDPDRNAAHVREADVAVALGGEKAVDSYLRTDLLLAAAREHGAQAIYPGYGFLSESAEFAEACEAAGIAFVGPTPLQIREFGLKHRSRELAAEAGVPMTPGTGLLASLGEALTQAERIGYPVMLKSTAGGGGIGLSRCDNEAELTVAFDSVQRMGEHFFRDGGAFIERYVDNARHVEVQIFGDGAGRVLALGERDCSVQRRNQKVIEETPAPHLPAATRAALLDAAVKLGESVAYRSAGTVEFIYDPARDSFYFLEVNTRLQVEHPVTEEVFGVDLVREQFRIAAGEPLSIPEDPTPRGHALEFRLNAEDPAYGFLPVPGPIDAFEAPTGPGVRMDSGVRTGSVVPGEYDSLLAKLIVWGEDRAQAIARARDALAELRIDGVPTVVPFHRAVLEQDAFTSGDRLGVYTTWIESEFAEPLAESPYLGAEVPAGGRTAVTVELDGRAVRLGLPADLYAALLGGGGAGAAAPAGAAGAGKPDDDGAVASPVTGTLASWKVEDGAEVAEGDTVAIVEAMKMETPIRAPRAGRIQLLVAETPASVTRGQAIARLGA